MRTLDGLAGGGVCRRSPGESLAVLGLGPVGQMAVRVAPNLGIVWVFGVVPVPGREPTVSV